MKSRDLPQYKNENAPSPYHKLYQEDLTLFNTIYTDYLKISFNPMTYTITVEGD